MAKFKLDQVKTVGVLCSGGDAPGMNAALRAVVRCGIVEGLEIMGVLNGYGGILARQFQPLDLRSVANILQRGGTVIKSGRCPEFLTPKARHSANDNLRAKGVDALVVIGGDGSFRGAQALWQEHQFPIVGVPGTIDNDIWGTDYTIGYDTAVNTALDAIDRIRDTAASHDRLFIVEVMGRESGFIAIEVGLAGGAEEIFIPESPVTIDEAIQHMQRGIARGKTSSILVTAEGQKPGRAYDLAEAIRKKSGFEAKVCVLGHIQRGGAPTARDRNLASRLGAASIRAIKSGLCDVMVGVRADQVSLTELAEATRQKRSVPRELIELARTLAN